jgi:proteasome accessory factor A
MEHARIVFGLETEWGISRDVGPGEEMDVVAESIALVRAFPSPAVRLRWDYRFEDPHADARGFRVSELRQDSDEANYTEQDAARPMSFSEIKSDLALTNGGRFYNDHAHPEYCTPECSTPDEIVIHDRAGERIVRTCAKILTESRGQPVHLYKNNTDFCGHSYGCHENYLLPRSLPWADLARGMEAYLVTRQLFAGAGKFGVEEEDRFVGHGFQLSQRADFFSELQSVDTMQRRPIVNTRDEPHANRERWRRFHVIIGDANLAPSATRLKMGVTALVLEGLVAAHGRHFDLHRIPQLSQPIESLRAISRDPTLKTRVPLTSGEWAMGLEIQRRYLDFTREALGEVDGWRMQIFSDWDEVLADLAADPERCADRLDWVAKRALIEGFRADQGLEETDPWLRSLDLAYSDLDADEGLYSGLEQMGGMRGIPPEALVEAATHKPPETTRAAVRGRLIEKFGSDVVAAQWDHVVLRGRSGPLRISLLDLFAPNDVTDYVAIVDKAVTVDDLKPLLKA